MGANWQKILTIALSLLAMTTLNCAIAKDFGVVGHSYKIEEQDIIEFIKSKLNTMDMAKLQREQENIVIKYTAEPKPVAGIVDTKEPREYLYDPSFILETDIRDNIGRIIHLAGTKINPLEHVKLGQDLVFINGNNQKQVSFALEHYKQKNEKVKIILVKGSPLNLQKKHKIWIYFDQNGSLTSKFGIKQVPAIITQDGLKLKINEVTL